MRTSWTDNKLHFISLLVQVNLINLDKLSSPRAYRVLLCPRFASSTALARVQLALPAELRAHLGTSRPGERCSIEPEVALPFLLSNTDTLREAFNRLESQQAEQERS